MIAALQQVLKLVAVSENERDSVGEPANLVDGLFAIARAIERAADTVASELEALQRSLERIETSRMAQGPPSAIPPRRRV